MRYLFAIPNGGHRNLLVAKKLKAEGGTVSKEQKQMMSELDENGYKCVVARGFEEAKKKRLRSICVLFTDKMKYVEMVFIGADAYMKTGDIQKFMFVANLCNKIDVEGYVRIEFFDNLVVTIGVAFDCLTIKNVVESISDPEIRIKKYYKNIDSKGFFKAVWELKQNYIKEVDNAEDLKKLKKKLKNI